MTPKPPPLPSSSISSEGAENHVDVDQLIEEYAWRYFKDMISLKRSSNLDSFKHLDREEVEFRIVSL